MTDNQKTVLSLVMMQLKQNETVTEDKIKTYVDAFILLNPLTELEKAEVIASLHSRLSIRMDRGSCLKEKDHVTWYYNAKKDLSSSYWERYRNYLLKDAGFNNNVMNSLDSSTDEMMDLLGNPLSEEDFKRRGLVIGDVQSGKTATYIALINKAADAGYKVIILLTGTIEKLRKQTQGRIDSGFIGLDSTALIRKKDNVYVGVGNYDPSVYSLSVTSASNDFNTNAASQFNGKLANLNIPIIFVLKKNKSILEKVEQWLRLYNANTFDKKIHLPMLLIDDEADNASVNTNKPDTDPTAINEAIRKLLQLFVHSNYVGYTATPFANIFINPDTDDEMIRDDLFPRDFIYALEAPTNYVGARSVFAEEGKYSYMLKGNDDCNDYLPHNHKKTFVPNQLPQSLKEAIASFFIANAVRDLRGQKKKHRSMLINISRFIDVQNQICTSIDGFVRAFQREIKNYYLKGDEALQHPTFAFLKHVYDKHFVPLSKLEEEPSFNYDWNEIQKSLYDSVASIIVRTVNGGNASKHLNYDECEEEGLRLIAVGGMSLSRGLTLEGLCTSYFFRNSKMYDTLMQMGRWFGYREGYRDVCQIWMSEEMINWYGYISVASDELRREVRRMQAENRTPKEFGLCVRSDINSLLVTARNKMRTAQDYERTVTLNGKVIETQYIHSDKDIINSNLKNVEEWIFKLQNDGFMLVKDSKLAVKHPQILNVPKQYIVELLDLYRSHHLNMNFRTNDLVQIIKNYDDDTVDKWDIVIANGKGSEGEFCGINTNFVSRRFIHKKDSRALQMSGQGSRLGSANYAKAGLSKKEVVEIESKEKAFQEKTGQKHGFSQELYFNSGIKRNPLLVIYPVELNPKTEIENVEIIDREKEKLIEIIGKPLVGLSIGIPRINGRNNVKYQYKINMVMYRELFEIDDDYEETDDTIFGEV